MSNPTERPLATYIDVHDFVGVLIALPSLFFLFSGILGGLVALSSQEANGQERVVIFLVGGFNIVVGISLMYLAFRSRKRIHVFEDRIVRRRLVSTRTVFFEDVMCYSIHTQTTKRLQTGHVGADLYAVGKDLLAPPRTSEIRFDVRANGRSNLKDISLDYIRGSIADNFVTRLGQVLQRQLGRQAIVAVNAGELYSADPLVLSNRGVLFPGEEAPRRFEECGSIKVEFDTEYKVTFANRRGDVWANLPTSGDNFWPGLFAIGHFATIGDQTREHEPDDCGDGASGG